ncbi:hypothetical protein ACFV2H_22880 [Streptomyces sp. NPDC059629]
MRPPPNWPCELALALGRGEEAPQVGLEIATTLTVRESTAPPQEE